MKINNVLGFVATTAFTLTAGAAFAAECPVNRSVYRDVEGRGFQLEFAPNTSNSATVHATATIAHPVRGTIFQFDITQSQGYGSTRLTNRNSPEKSYELYFFDAGLRHSSVLLGRGSAPSYAFVAGLGSTDYYMNQNSRSREIPLADVMWQFDHCK